MMKKSLVALAALAVAGIASAQSSVTLFGVLDAGVSYYDAKANAANGSSVKQSQWAQSSSGYNSSRLGFRGTEDLGGGLAASFWLEAGLNNDNGAAGGSAVTSGTTTAVNLFNRRSTVSLSGGFGEVRIGRDYTPTFWNDTIFDPFGTNGTNVLTSAHTGDVNYVRASNTVGYFLPTNLGGFYGQVQYGLSEQVKTTGLNASTAGRYVGGRFGYANGPLDVAVAYGQSTAAVAAATTPGAFAFSPVTGLITAGAPVVNNGTKIKTANLGASYDFGVVKAFGELSQVKTNTDSFAGLDTSNKLDGLLVGVTAPVGAGLIRASFSTVKLKVVGDDPRANKFALGYVHNLSKRTALYATVAHVNNKNGAAVLVGGSPVYGAITPKSANGYDFGVRHAF